MMGVEEMLHRVWAASQIVLITGEVNTLKDICRDDPRGLMTGYKSSHFSFWPGDLNTDIWPWRESTGRLVLDITATFMDRNLATSICNSKSRIVPEKIHPMGFVVRVCNYKKSL